MTKLRAWKGEKGNLQELFDGLRMVNTPRLAGAFSKQEIVLLKIIGPQHWHAAAADTLYYVFSGLLYVQWKDHSADLRNGDFIVVPGGRKHRIVSAELAAVVILRQKEARK